VFSTIAAESQRLINETYSAFVQGFMPTLARPDVDSLDGLTTAIILDQERMGANVRSTVGTVTDANAFLRVVFSRIGRPHIGGPQAFAFNIPSVSGAGAITVARGSDGGVTERRTFSVAGGMCPHCEGMGTATEIDLTQLYDESRSLAEGAIRVPGYTADGFATRMYTESGFLDPDKPIRDYTPAELHDFLYKEPVKVRISGINLTYRGLVPRIQESMLSKDPVALQPHLRAFVERAVTFSTCPDCGGTRLNAAARSSKIAGISIADACAMQISDLAAWVHGLDEPSVRPLLASLGSTLDSFVEMGLGYLSLDRPSGTLSGGEAQRTRMIRHLGASLTDVTYVFDEPTIGLHAHDVQRMNALLRRLRDKGNTVLVVEHDPEVIRIADGCLPRTDPSVTVIDQSAIRGSRRSNPATYTGILDPIRTAFARANGVKPALFSANSEGACPNCNGLGKTYTSLGFMAEVVSICEVCEGRRYSDDVLEHRLRGRNIVEVLAMSVEEARDFFTERPVRVMLERLADVGLGYLSLGQELDTLSGGERQRLKLAIEISGATAVYVLDEPTTGLHMQDVENLIALLDRLVDAGRTVIVIEHDLDVIARADWVIDLGPGGGHDGGRVIFEGPPAELVRAEGSLTGQHLRRRLEAVAGD
jgi:excinuclease UvrABC ATPase subunit